MNDEKTLTACLWFDGKAEEAARLYTSVLPGSILGNIRRAPADYPAGRQGDVLTVEFTLMGRPFMGLNAGPAYKFNEAVSLMIPVTTQAESERIYAALSADPQAEVCGWIKDRYGLSWQIVPVQLTQLMKDPDPAIRQRVFEAMMTMHRIDIAGIEAAARG